MSGKTIDTSQRHESRKPAAVGSLQAAYPDHKRAAVPYWARRSPGRPAMIAATGTGLVRMRVSKAVALAGPALEARPREFVVALDELDHLVVLDELDGDRHLVISVGHAEAFGLAASLQDLRWARPMTYEFTAALVRSLGGEVREVRLDRIVDGAYAATVKVEGPKGTQLVDARASDALNLAVLTGAPVLVAPQVLEDCVGRQQGDSAEAVLLRRALAAGPMAIKTALLPATGGVDGG